MMLLIKIAALQLIWLASLPIYLTASQQIFLKEPLNKKLAWPVFFGLSCASAFVFSLVYHPLTSVLFSLCALMACWIILALWAHQSTSFKQLFFSGVLVCLFIGLLGGEYVV